MEKPITSPEIAPITLDGAGRIVLPSALRRRLNLKPGSKLKAEIVAEHIQLTPEPEPEGAAFGTSASRRRVLKKTGKPLDAASATRAERESRASVRKRA